MTLFCLTNDLDEFRSCTSRDAHLTICTGRVLRYDQPRNRWEAGTWTDLGECTGCLPREARHGLLCTSCWFKVEHAATEWTDQRARLLASIDRAVQRAGGGGSAEGYVPIPGTRLAVDEVNSYRRSGLGLTLEQWVASAPGATDALRFARAVPIALRTHQLEEQPTEVKRVRCPYCAHVTLVWKPPHDAAGHVVIDCMNAGCRRQLKQEELAYLEHGLGHLSVTEYEAPA